MDATLFTHDVESRPESLQDLQRVLVTDDPWARLPEEVGQVLFLGMGSSTFAAQVAAARLRSLGVDAIAELASSELLPPPDTEQLVVAISASGGSRETVDAVQQYAGQSPVVAVTNVEGSPITELADDTVLLHAGPERGGVSCRSYTHTQILLLALEERLSGVQRDLLSVVGRSIEAARDLISRQAAWLPQLVEVMDGADQTAVVGPFRRLGNAEQSALMLREGPRRPALAAETGEWSHVDVYLTKTQDYRMLLMPGSKYEDELWRWATERGSTVVTVGSSAPNAARAVRYRHDDDEDVRLLTELIVAELLAADLWQAQEKSQS
ncbi:MAG TPA: SIS domain-containing protein [Actinomycetes bacterium]|nr:SIS domain-containing protein [Actinomycetes bacterium]